MQPESDQPALSVAWVFGQAVKKLRQERGLTQRELAELLVPYLPTWTKNTVAATEIGRRETSISETLALSHAFGCTLNDLLPADAGEVYVGKLLASSAVEQLTDFRDEKESMWSVRVAMATPWELRDALRDEQVYRRAAELGIADEQPLTIEMYNQLAELPPMPDGPGSPDKFAAQKFGLSMSQVADLAQRRYGHSLYVERWKRESAVSLLHHGVPDEIRPLLPEEKSVRGARIAISRSLMAEIEEEARALSAPSGKQKK